MLQTHARVSSHLHTSGRPLISVGMRLREARPMVSCVHRARCSEHGRRQTTAFVVCQSNCRCSFDAQPAAGGGCRTAVGCCAERICTGRHSRQQVHRVSAEDLLVSSMHVSRRCCCLHRHCSLSLAQMHPRPGLALKSSCRKSRVCVANRFALQADPAKQPIHFPRCAFVDCKFDVEKELVCPFAAGGAFVETQKTGCPDFMKACHRPSPRHPLSVCQHADGC
jgi:hypothetical protein